MRVRKGAARTRQRKRLRRRTKGYYGARHRNRRSMMDAVMRSGRHAYFGRKIRKRDERSLWIMRINGALTGRALSYSRFMNGLRRAGVGLNRKMLAQIAVLDPAAFDRVVEVARSALGAGT